MREKFLVTENFEYIVDDIHFLGYNLYVKMFRLFSDFVLKCLCGRVNIGADRVCGGFMKESGNGFEKRMHEKLYGEAFGQAEFKFEFDTWIFEYPENAVVERIEVAFVRYDLQKNVYIQEFTIICRDGVRYTWEKYQIELKRGVWLDPEGTRMFVCSMAQKLYCFDLKTGDMLWGKPRRITNQIVINDNMTLTSRSYKGFFVMDFDGKIVKELKMTGNDYIYDLGHGLFLIRILGKNWNIIDAKDLITYYEIPRRKLGEGLRSIEKIGDTLYLKYSGDESDDPDDHGEDELDLTPYKKRK